MKRKRKYPIFIQLAPCIPKRLVNDSKDIITTTKVSEKRNGIALAFTCCLEDQSKQKIVIVNVPEITKTLHSPVLPEIINKKTLHLSSYEIHHSEFHTCK
ncbi:hypothetical protein MANES_01G061850v8 [Manihot esculenta]|uniref:Uncharacterized protein n=1 Tax=Manihot esculenta TaxID=3983 RepID=A0ACB7IB57_MANES|nr:hypothetical protein MANES_01G061850v8 [Manihot esculenta]